MKSPVIVAFLLTLLFFGCRSEPDPQVSFYYWKTVFKLSNFEIKTLKENAVTKLYIRYFDISLNQENKKPFPESPVVFKNEIGNYIIVPVVYIKNEVFLNTETNLSDLAIKTNNYIEQINKHLGIHSPEIQIDCDWTLSSRDKYMTFINILKKESKKILSATIRLHQVKYSRQTKVPEVDYGVLMYYNMGKLAADNHNSIYERSIALKYLSQLKSYPLPLRIALPIYSWGVHIRDKRVVKVISKINSENFAEDTNFVSNGNSVFVKNPNLKFGQYFKKGDQIKIENVTAHQLMEMENDLNKNFKKRPTEIIFYDLDSINLSRYDKKIYQKMAHSF